MTEALDPLTLPLHGSRLIEASAGTGKTWTIAALYVRLVVGHACAPRLPGEILVMTFTRAATRELADRIRRRLVEAAACFRGEAGAQHDPFLADLATAFAAGPERQQAAWRLALAAEAMDDAAVHTIDAWCQRMLREHAFDSGCLFDEELQAQEAAMRAEAVRDYWRQQVYPLADDALPGALARWKDVAALDRDVAALLDKPLPPPAGQGNLADALARVEAERAGATGSKTLPDPGPALRLHAAAHVRARMQQLKARAGSYGFADMLDRLDRALDESAHAAPDEGARRAHRENAHRARARRLRERILAQYPVALIDEFQDTSPVQLRIFDRLYRIADNDPARALLLIGDPKQAIYQFRGADIYSYLRARRATAGRHYALDTNHRSTQGLVRAVNALFTAAEERPGEGAFMFRRADAPPDLPFVAVRARGRAERLVHAGGEVAPVTLRADEALRNKEGSRGLFAALCAEHIVGLLNDPRAGFEQDGEAFRRLRPADIAVLVSNRTEAAAVRDEMRRRGLASVYLSDQDSVFQTPEAADLLRLLQAVAAPRDMRLARAALATALLGFTLPELVALASDDAAFDRECERLQQLGQVWKGQGVLAMVRQALHGFGLPARWLSAPGAAGEGERRLTNVLHLAELLQAASAQVDGEHALVRWLLRQLTESDEGLHGADELVLRLESDADLVKVVTVHASKGLEYPLVFLPFAAHFRELVGPGESPKDAVLLLPTADAASNGEAGLVLAPSKEQLAMAERERQREHLRLLYVALTRARHALWVGLSGLQVGNAKTYLWQRSAIGYLLSGAGTQPPEQRIVDIQARASAELKVELVRGDEDTCPPPATRLQPRGAAPPLAAAPAYAAQFERNWSVASYTALVRDAARATPGAETAPQRVVRDDEPDEAQAGTPAAPPQRSAHQPWHRFPRGALAGNFLHDQLEWLAGEGFALDDSAELQQRLLRRCERQGWGHRGDDVLAWLRRVCSTPLPVVGTSLARLATAVPEMEFWFPSDGLHTRRVDALCRQHLQPGQPRPQLPERALAGMFMGFADLVFEHGGRYWVLDYKSNTLGANDAGYTPAAMDVAMLEHRYDVQAALYLVALHRLLKARLGPGYDPAHHLGGAVYLFLRGVNGPAAGCCPIGAPLALIEAIDAVLPAGRSAAQRESA